MDFNDTNSSSSLSFYLQQLDIEPLLTKEEEEELVKNIEVLQDNILLDCTKFYFFKDEFTALLKGENIGGNDVVKLSKKLDDESSEKQKEVIRSNWIKLVDYLVKDSHDDKIKSSIRNIGLSGNVVNSLVNRIKKKYNKVLDCDSKLKYLIEFFELTTPEELETLIHKIKFDDKYRKILSVKLMSSDSSLLLKIHEYEEYKNRLVNLESIGLKLKDLPELKKLYATITKNEYKMKQYKDILIRRNLRLVVSRAKKHIGKGLELEDLIQEGNIGLIKAINKYDLSRGTKIGTYATWWIDQSIKRAISNKSRTVRIPTHIEWLQTTLAGVISELTAEYKRVPTLKEISDRSGHALHKLEGLYNRAMHKVGLDEEIGSGMKLIDVLSDDPGNNPFSITSKKILRDKIRNIISSLSPRSEKIIRLRFGIGEPHEELTLQQIANRVGLTRMGVGVVEKKVLKKIKKNTEDLND